MSRTKVSKGEFSNLSRRGEIHRKPNSLAKLRMSQGQKGKKIPPRTQRELVDSLIEKGSR